MSHNSSDVIGGGERFDFFKCLRCRRLVTDLEMERALRTGGNGKPCPCGGVKFSPRNLAWFDWFKPRVLWFAFLRVRGAA